MQMAVLEHASLHWRQDGDPQGLPVVFANSLGTDLRVWDKVVPYFPENLRLIRFDTRGHGLSSCPDGPYSISDLTNDTADLLDHLAIKDCVFVGLSIGGLIGQKLASICPELVRAMVLSNSAAKMGDAAMWQGRIASLVANGIEPIADQIMERWFNREFRQTPELTAWRNMLTRTPVIGYVACCHAIASADLSGDTARLTLPFLGVGGSQDNACPSDIVAQTTALVPGSRFHDIMGAGHLPCVEKPELYAKLITKFITELGHG